MGQSNNKRETVFVCICVHVYGEDAISYFLVTMTYISLIKSRVRHRFFAGTLGIFFGIPFLLKTWERLFLNKFINTNIMRQAFTFSTWEEKDWKRCEVCSNLRTKTTVCDVNKLVVVSLLLTLNIFHTVP